MPTIALIPAYEPTEILIDLTKRLFDSHFAVLIVDDGSGPDYQKIFQRCRPYAAVLSYEPNQGKGHALKTGYRYIRDNFGADSVVVTMDSDGQHTVADAKKIAERAAASPGALILGVRDFGPGTPPRSQFGNTVTRVVFTLSTGLRVSDTQTGLRGFTVRMIPFLSGVPGNRYEYEMNVLLQCARRDISLLEEPIQTIYMDGNKGSHFHTLRDSFRIYKNILQFAASSFTAFCIDYGLYSVLAVGLAGLGTDVSIPVANITARTVSASANFAINKRFVFRNTDSAMKTGTQYFLLAAGILLGNTVLLSFLVNSLGINQFTAKLATELTFFTLSWAGQKFWIFRRSGERACDMAKNTQD
ncbi:bifunctional glycosyltransferase family 2/GtrA family protein [Faecalispora anaeroviscerum]|uniref:bifunctional glycosyltransferase family 2/GtrA family protein n=1 Tax=Faecalispora anaeroviscerum TaxID=2991836 RepID=UPI0024BA729E|nr:bifunctional glycosyltransferase family 2/GtrA family protein [Faecalispora anaeroviscerum]